MSEVRPKKQARDPITYLPRYPTADNIGALAKKIWKRPKFRVVQNPDVTEFIFSLGFSIPKKLRNQELASYLLLFDRKRNSWKHALKQAYKTARYGSDRVRDLSDRVLFRVFVEALAILFEEAKHSEGPYKGFVKGGAKAVLEAAKRIRRPPDSERKPAAMRMAKRYYELLPQVKLLREFVCRHPQRSDESILREAIERDFPHEWTQQVTWECVLKNLPVIPGHSKLIESLAGMKWTPRQLAVGIIWCEERLREPTFPIRPTTILNDYLPLGKKLNTKLN